MLGLYRIQMCWVFSLDRVYCIILVFLKYMCMKSFYILECLRYAFCIDLFSRTRRKVKGRWQHNFARIDTIFEKSNTFTEIRSCDVLYRVSSFVWSMCLVNAVLNVGDYWFNIRSSQSNQILSNQNVMLSI